MLAALVLTKHLACYVFDCSLKGSIPKKIILVIFSRIFGAYLIHWNADCGLCAKNCKIESGELLCCLKKQFNPNILRKLNQLCDTKCGCFRMNLLLFKEKNVASFVHLLSKKKHSEWIEHIKLPLENDKVIHFPLINLDSSKSTYKSTYVWNESNKTKRKAILKCSSQKFHFFGKDCFCVVMNIAIGKPGSQFTCPESKNKTILCIVKPEIVCS